MEELVEDYVSENMAESIILTKNNKKVLDLDNF
jgi:hypothetical protein